MKRRRRRDVLRVQLVRIFELLADAGVVSQMYVTVRDQFTFIRLVSESRRMLGLLTVSLATMIS